MYQGKGILRVLKQDWNIRLDKEAYVNKKTLSSDLGFNILAKTPRGWYSLLLEAWKKQWVHTKGV